MIAAAVPLKRLSGAKSRLTPHLPVHERQRLARSLVEQTVRALRDSNAIDRIALATPETALAANVGVEQLPDRKGLNAALRGAVDWATRIGASRLIIVPGDLPLVDAESVRALVRAPHGERSVTIAATQDGGTGVLVLTPPDVIPPSFGSGSFERHRSLALEQGASVHEVAGVFAFDLDTVDDLESYRLSFAE